MGEQQHASDHEEQHRDDAVERLGLEARRRFRSGPRADQAAGQEVHDDGPLCTNLRKGHGGRAKRQGGCDHDQAGRFVENDASRPTKRNKLISNGRRNSAPPSPMSPPNIPIKAPVPNPAGLRRNGTPGLVLLGNISGRLNTRIARLPKPRGLPSRRNKRCPARSRHPPTTLPEQAGQAILRPQRTKAIRR